jgi:transcription factor SFP1
MLADLHELVGHFEEQHVTVVSPTGVPLWYGSPSSAGFSGSSSSCSASPTSPNPHPFPTLTSAFTPVMTSGSRDPGAYLAQNCLSKEEEHVFDTMLHSEVYEHAPASVVPQHTMTHENASTSYDNGNYDNVSYDKLGYTGYDTTAGIAGTAGTAASATTGDVPADSPTHVHPATIAPTPVHARPPTLSIITDAEPERTSGGERRKKGRRERVHKCPHEGCVKVRAGVCCA